MVRCPEGVYQTYRSSAAEKAREADLLRLVPSGRRLVLDIGARDGHYSRLLSRRFSKVFALDLEKPPFQYPHVETVAGDVTNLTFENDQFDCVFCAEVLEHVGDVEKACAEITRVARHEVIIGVPYRQDTRVGRTTCAECNRTNPPYGHINSFDEERLIQLFPGLRPVSWSFVGATRNATTSLATWLMDLAGNPWGTYGQEESCRHCGAQLTAPQNHRSAWSRACAGIAVRMNQFQERFTAPRANWIHMLFSKEETSL